MDDNHNHHHHHHHNDDKESNQMKSITDADLKNAGIKRGGLKMLPWDKIRRRLTIELKKSNRINERINEWLNSR